MDKLGIRLSGGQRQHIGHRQRSIQASRRHHVREGHQDILTEAA